MRKTLFWLVSLVLLVTPAVAQHGHSNSHPTYGVHQHGNGERPNVGVRQRGNGDEHREWRGEERRDDHRERDFHEREERRDVFRNERNFHEHNEFHGYHYGYGSPRGHWDGRRFDRDYFDGHWGYGHRFYWGHCNWFGPRYYPGSYFWYNGVYFVIVDPVPPGWYDDPVVIVFDNGGYWLVDPMYPGARIAVSVRF